MIEKTEEKARDCTLNQQNDNENDKNLVRLTCLWPGLVKSSPQLQTRPFYHVWKPPYGFLSHSEPTGKITDGTRDRQNDEIQSTNVDEISQAYHNFRRLL